MLNEERVKQMTKIAMFEQREKLGYSADDALWKKRLSGASSHSVFSGRHRFLSVALRRNCDAADLVRDSESEYDDVDPGRGSRDSGIYCLPLYLSSTDVSEGSETLSVREGQKIKKLAAEYRVLEEMYQQERRQKRRKAGSDMAFFVQLREKIRHFVARREKRVLRLWYFLLSLAAMLTINEAFGYQDALNHWWAAKKNISEQ